MATPAPKRHTPYINKKYDKLDQTKGYPFSPRSPNCRRHAECLSKLRCELFVVGFPGSTSFPVHYYNRNPVSVLRCERLVVVHVAHTSGRARCCSHRRHPSLDTLAGSAGW